MYSTEIASFLGSLQKLSVDEYMLYSIVLLQGCGIMYKVVMWRLGCTRSGKKKKVAYKDPESLIERVVVVQPVESKKVSGARSGALSGQAHSITTDTTDTLAPTVEVITEKV